MKNCYRLLLSLFCGLCLSGLTAFAETATSTGVTASVEAAAKSAKLLERLRIQQPTFGLSDIAVLQPEVGGYPLWQYCASLIWVILAFVVAAVIDMVMTNQLRRLTAKTKTKLDDKLVEILHTPIKVIVTMLMLNAGIHMFQWPDWVESMLGTVFIMTLAGMVIYLLMRLVDLAIEFAEEQYFADDRQMAKLMVPVVSKSLKVFVLIIGVLTTAQYMGLPITSVIAGLGIGGVAVALAAQNTLANVFGTIAILSDRPFRVGDRIQIDKYDGAVEAIGLRSTRLRTADGHLVTIPNKTVADSGIANIALRPTIREMFNVGLTYDTTPEKMQEAVTILREILQRHPMTHDSIVSWKSFGPSSLDILVVYWCKTTDFKEFLKAMEEINGQIKQRFDAAKLEFAFPTQTIQMQTVPLKA